MGYSSSERESLEAERVAMGDIPMEPATGLGQTTRDAKSGTVLGWNLAEYGPTILVIAGALWLWNGYARKS